jgi:hypothetical protein
MRASVTVSSSGFRFAGSESSVCACGSLCQRLVFNARPAGETHLLQQVECLNTARVLQLVRVDQQ